jgi:hypothetical protein
MITVVGLLIKYYVKKKIMWRLKKSWRPIAKNKKLSSKKNPYKLRKNQAQLNWHMFSKFWKVKKMRLISRFELVTWFNLVYNLKNINFNLVGF